MLRMLRRSDDVDDADLEIVPDGGSVRVPLYLTDSSGFRRGYVQMSDERSAHDKLSDAYQRRAAFDARQEMIRRAETAWKHPPTRDAAQPDTGSPPEELRRHLRGNEPDDDPRSRQTERGENQRRRDAAWNSYKDQLANAWRNPPHVAWAERSIVGGGPRSMVIERTGKTDPGRAGEIERQGERWRHGR